MLIVRRSAAGHQRHIPHCTCSSQSKFSTGSQQGKDVRCSSFMICSPMRMEPAENSLKQKLLHVTSGLISSRVGLGRRSELKALGPRPNGGGWGGAAKGAWPAPHAASRIALALYARVPGNLALRYRLPARKHPGCTPRRCFRAASAGRVGRVQCARRLVV